MKILDKVVENNSVKKSGLLKASDKMLTPYRKVFNGKTYQVITNDNEMPEIQDISDKPSKGMKKVLWGVAAVVSAPLAAVAAICKIIIRPSIDAKSFHIDNEESLQDDIDEIIKTLRPLIKLGLSGEIRVFIPLTAEQQGMVDRKAAASVMDDLHTNCFSSITIQEDKNKRVACLGGNLLAMSIRDKSLRS